MQINRLYCKNAYLEKRESPKTRVSENAYLQKTYLQKRALRILKYYYKTYLPRNAHWELSLIIANYTSPKTYTGTRFIAIKYNQEDSEPHHTPYLEQLSLPPFQKSKNPMFSSFPGLSLESLTPIYPPTKKIDGIFPTFQILPPTSSDTPKCYDCLNFHVYLLLVRLCFMF